MYWPTDSQPVPLTELGWVNSLYLGNANSRTDPTIIWGTTIDAEPLESLISALSRRGGPIISQAHLLIRAVAQALIRHPLLNSRVIGRSVHRYRGVSIVMPMLQTRSGEVDTIFLQNAESLSVTDIACRLWEEARERALQAAAAKRLRTRESTPALRLAAAARWARVHWVRSMSWLAFGVTNRLRFPTLFQFDREYNGTNAFVNYLGFPGAPPMISYKPSCLSTNSFSVSVTMGPAEACAVAVNGSVAIRRQAPLFVRVDHRMVNGYQTGQFVSTLRSFLMNPDSLMPTALQPAEAIAS